MLGWSFYFRRDTTLSEHKAQIGGKRKGTKTVFSYEALASLAKVLGWSFYFRRDTTLSEHKAQIGGERKGTKTVFSYEALASLAKVLGWSFYFRRDTTLSEHKAQIGGKGKGTKTVFSYEALASRTYRQQSSFNHFLVLFLFFPLILYNNFIHPPTTLQSPEYLHLLHESPT